MCTTKERVGIITRVLLRRSVMRDRAHINLENQTTVCCGRRIVRDLQITTAVKAE